MSKNPQNQSQNSLPSDPPTLKFADEPNPNISISNNNSNTNTKLLQYYKSKVTSLEIENKQLKEEIKLFSSEKDLNLLDYYLRLRNDLVKEIESLKYSNNQMQIQNENEKAKLKTEIKRYQSPEINKTKNYFKSNMNTVTNQVIPIEKNIISTSGTNNYALKNDKKINQSLQSNNANNSNSYPANINLSNISNSSSLNNDSIENQKMIELQKESSQNIFRLKDQEKKIKELTSVIMKNEESAKKEIDDWKLQYNSLLGSKESLSKEYENYYNKLYEDYRKNNEIKQYELEKKVIHLEEVVKNKENDLNLAVKLNTEHLTDKENNINQLKDQVKTIQSNYEIMYKLYCDHLASMKNNLNNMKNLYITRENEFVNITNYYIKMVEEYSKPLSDEKNIRNTAENTFKKYTEEILNLQKQVEDLSREVGNKTNENLNIKSKNRIKLTQTIKEYDEQMKTINKNYSEIKADLSVLKVFTSKLDSKITLFNSINEDNKKLLSKVNKLECQLKMNDSETKNKLIISLKEKIMKCEKELESRNEQIKDYENMFKEYQDKNRDINDDVVMKLNAEISRLNSQVLNIEKSKEFLVKFYQNEINILLDKISTILDQNEELQTALQKIENDDMCKKETLLNLWMLEYNEFKNNLLTAENIQNIITKFNIQGDELKKNHDFLINDEHHQMKLEIQNKDDYFDKLKQSHIEENKKNQEIIDHYKKTIEDKIKNYDTLIEGKKKELNAIKLEKEKLIKFDKNKQQLLEQEKINWEKQKNSLEKIIQDQFDLKNCDIEKLKETINHLETEMINTRKLYDDNLTNAINLYQEQIKLIKDREDYSVKQVETIQNQFNVFKADKERIVALLRKEIEQLKNFNLLLSKEQNSNILNSNNVSRISSKAYGLDSSGIK